MAAKSGNLDRAVDDCYICGDCWWIDCPNPADYSMDVDLKRHGRPLFSGKVDICHGHYVLVHANGGRLDLKPLALEQAKAVQRAKIS